MKSYPDYAKLLNTQSLKVNYCSWTGDFKSHMCYMESRYFQQADKNKEGEILQKQRMEQNLKYYGLKHQDTLYASSQAGNLKDVQK
ncbi:hypothetical protein BTUL_0058g00250 [Botrytis tulipae]|uniref:Uncharacterized protein n=1 Tax=Botrytis tulipae TaxID=87230 RepID=A0A4Z1ERJ2_9HELO|nr:hypothetical protein BTUL_0058g00250 [Botrytis tulipae]